MAKYKVDEFVVELGFSEKILSGLTNVEKKVNAAAERIEKRFNQAFNRLSGAEKTGSMFAKIERQATTAANHIQKEMRRAFDIKGIGSSAVKSFESDSTAAAKRVAKQFQQAFRVKMPGTPYYGGTGRQPSSGSNTPTPSTGRGSGGLNYIQRQDKWMESHNIRNTENGMTNVMSRMGLTSELATFRGNMNALLDKYKGTGNTREYEREARRLIFSYKDVIREHKAYEKALQRSRFMNEKLTASTMHLVTQFASIYTAIEIFKSAIDAGRQRTAANIASDSVFKRYGANASQNAKLFSYSFANQVGQSFTDTLKQLTAFTASAAPSMGIGKAQDFYKASTLYARSRGLTSEQIKSANLAFEQMASKGTVQSQELKLQLANAMPGAEQLFAKAVYGKDDEKAVAKLLNDMSNGLLKSSKVLPLVAKEMMNQIGSAQDLAKMLDNASVAMDRMGGSTQNWLTRLYNGMENGLKDLANAVAYLFDSNGENAKFLGEALGFVMDALAGVINVIATVGMNFQGLIGIIQAEFEKLPKPVQDVLKNLGDLTSELAKTAIQIAVFAGAIRLIKSAIGLGGAIAFGKKALPKLLPSAAESTATKTVVEETAGTGLKRLIPGVGQLLGMYEIFNRFQDLKDSIVKGTPGSTGIWDAIKQRSGGWYGYEHKGTGMDFDASAKGLPDWMTRTITIPPDAFNNVKMPAMKGTLDINLTMPDGSVQKVTAPFINDQFENMVINNQNLRTGWEDQSQNAGWYPSSVSNK